jgi:hypothetical protein
MAFTFRVGTEGVPYHNSPDHPFWDGGRHDFFGHHNMVVIGNTNGNQFGRLFQHHLKIRRCIASDKNIRNHMVRKSATILPQLVIFFRGQTSQRCLDPLFTFRR